jgi:hypothetical protein
MQEITCYYAFELLDMGRALSWQLPPQYRLVRLGLRRVRFYDAER